MPNITAIEQITAALQEAGFEVTASTNRADITTFLSTGSTATLTLENGSLSVFRRAGEIDVLAGEFGIVKDANIKDAVRAFKFHSV